MRKIFPVLIFLILWTATSCLGAAEKGENNLIPVKPSYQEASYVPDAKRPASNSPYVRSGPTPREQMYVFWIFGKVLSYPIDRAESFIRGMLTRSPAKPAAVPAGVKARPDPFQSADLREIPPAPPALGEHGKHAR
ncbi:MAG: hypothetical protein P8182_03080 [Deltaproteobacteria bacterium]